MRVEWARTSLRYAALLAAALVMVLPLVWAVATALTPMGEVFSDPPRMIPSHPQWANVHHAWTKLHVGRFTLNSAIITLPAVAGAVLTSAMAGFALARFRWRARWAAMILLVASLLVPTQLLLVPRFLLFSGLGWVGTYKPLILPAWLGGGAFNVLLFRQFFRSMSTDLEDAARLEGATEWLTFTRIALPAAKPAIAVTALLSFTYHWNDFLHPLIYLSHFETFPLSLGLRMYQAVSGSWMNLVMAASLISMIPVLIVFFVLQRSFESAAGVRRVG